MLFNYLISLLVCEIPILYIIVITIFNCIQYSGRDISQRVKVSTSWEIDCGIHGIHLPRSEVTGRYSTIARTSYDTDTKHCLVTRCCIKNK